MSANYLNEAFTQLQLLNEEEFNLTDKDSIEDIKSLVDAPVDASIDIIDQYYQCSCEIRHCVYMW